MMRVVFVNRFYWPETPATGQLLTDLAEGLARLGHDVTVVTSAAPAAARRNEERHGVQIRRIRGTRWDGAGTLGKAVDFATFLLGALWHVAGLARRGSVVVAMTDPPLLGVGLGFVARLRSAHLVHWVQDIYPEIAVTLTRHTWLASLRPLRNRAWRLADGCVTVGMDMADGIAAAGVPRACITVIPNWAPLGVTALGRADAGCVRGEWNAAGRFVVAYSGNLGRVHDLMPMLELAAALRDEPAIAFVVVGDGAQRAALEAEAARARLTNVAFRPPEPRARLAESLAAADLHLVTLRPGCERLVFPSKLYGIAAAGRPVLCIAPAGAEVARVVAAHGLGLAAERTDIAAMSAFVRLLARDATVWKRHAEAARGFARGHDAAGAVRRWDAVLRSLHACGAIGRPPDTAGN